MVDRPTALRGSKLGEPPVVKLWSLRRPVFPEGDEPRVWLSSRGTQRGPGARAPRGSTGSAAARPYRNRGNRRRLAARCPAPPIAGTGSDFQRGSGPGLARLESMRHLDTLFLTNTAFGDSTAVYLSRLTRLKNLSLELTNITDAGRGSRR